MIKALIRTVLLIALVLVLARFVPAVAEYQTLLLVMAIALGLLGFILRAFLVLIVVLAVGVFLKWYGIY